MSLLRPLDARFVYLPCQAVKCSLKVKPFVELSSPELKGSGIPQWPEHTKKWFRSLLTGKQVSVLFLTANSSNHAQVDVAINREFVFIIVVMSAWRFVHHRGRQAIFTINSLFCFVWGIKFHVYSQAGGI